MQIIASILSLLVPSILLISKAAADQTDNPAIVVVIDSTTHLDELCHTFYTLIHATGFSNAPVIAFTAIPLNDEDVYQLRSCTPRDVSFVGITAFHATLPDGVSIKGIRGAQTDYSQTQRFLTGYIWDEPILEPYDVLMHITDHTCLTFDSDFLPGFPPSETPLNYKSYSIPGVLELTKYTVGLYPITLEYISGQSVSPVNVELWTNVVKSHDLENKLPKFSDDFEIVRKSFMQSPEVNAYHRHLTDSAEGALEFFKRKWPVSCIRHITVALFAEAESTSITHVPGIVEKNIWQGNLYPNICRAKVVSDE